MEENVFLDLEVIQDEGKRIVKMSSSYKLKILVFLTVICLVGNFFSPISASKNQGEASIDPQIVLLYPESLENGSNYWPGEFIYFTLGGNLSLVEFGDYIIYYNWNNDTRYKIGPLKNGIGIVLEGTREVIFDAWDTLTFHIYLVNEDQKELLIYLQSFQFYAKPDIPYEPFSVTPVNYPNNSVFYDLNYYQGELVLLFKVDGFELDYQKVLAGGSSYAEEVTFAHKWDDQTEWMNESVNTYRLTGYDYMPFNYFGLAPYSFHDNGTHSLYIRLSNKTHEEIFHFRYTLIDYTKLPDVGNWYIWNEDFYWRVGDLKPFVVGETNYDIIYNWNDGTGNHTINSSDWLEASGWLEGSGWAGYYNITVPNLGVESTGYGSLTIWINNAPPIRYSFSYETVIPQIDLYYPIDDFSKLGMTPVVWSVCVAGRGTIDYGQYRFSLFYETNSHEKTLVIDDYNPLKDIYQSWHKEDLSEYHLFKLVFKTLMSESDPMVVGYEFVFSDFLADDETDGLRFIINETTTNTVINISPRFSYKQTVNTDPDPIKSGITEWLAIQYSNFSANPFKEKSTPLYIGSFLAGLIVLVLFRLKGKQNQ